MSKYACVVLFFFGCVTGVYAVQKKPVQKPYPYYFMVNMGNNYLKNFDTQPFFRVQIYFPKAFKYGGVGVFSRVALGYQPNVQTGFFSYTPLTSHLQFRFFGGLDLETPVVASRQYIRSFTGINVWWHNLKWTTHGYIPLIHEIPLKSVNKIQQVNGHWYSNYTTVYTLISPWVTSSIDYTLFSRVHVGVGGYLGEKDSGGIAHIIYKIMSIGEKNTSNWFNVIQFRVQATYGNYTKKTITGGFSFGFGKGSLNDNHIVQAMSYEEVFTPSEYSVENLGEPNNQILSVHNYDELMLGLSSPKVTTLVLENDIYLPNPLLVPENKMICSAKCFNMNTLSYVQIENAKAQYYALFNDNGNLLILTNNDSIVGVTLKTNGHIAVMNEPNYVPENSEERGWVILDNKIQDSIIYFSATDENSTPNIYIEQNDFIFTIPKLQLTDEEIRTLFPVNPITNQPMIGVINLMGNYHTHGNTTLYPRIQNNKIAFGSYKHEFSSSVAAIVLQGNLNYAKTPSSANPMFLSVLYSGDMTGDCVICLVQPHTLPMDHAQNTGSGQLYSQKIINTMLINGNVSHILSVVFDGSNIPVSFVYNIGSRLVVRGNVQDVVNIATNGTDQVQGIDYNGSHYFSSLTFGTLYVLSSIGESVYALKGNLSVVDTNFEMIFSLEVMSNMPHFFLVDSQVHTVSDVNVYGTIVSGSIGNIVQINSGANLQGDLQFMFIESKGDMGSLVSLESGSSFSGDMHFIGEVIVNNDAHTNTLNSVVNMMGTHTEPVQFKGTIDVQMGNYYKITQLINASYINWAGSISIGLSTLNNIRGNVHSLVELHNIVVQAGTNGDTYGVHIVQSPYGNTDLISTSSGAYDSWISIDGITLPDASKFEVELNIPMYGNNATTSNPLQYMVFMRNITSHLNSTLSIRIGEKVYGEVQPNNPLIYIANMGNWLGTLQLVLPIQNHSSSEGNLNPFSVLTHPVVGFNGGDTLAKSYIQGTLYIPQWNIQNFGTAQLIVFSNGLSKNNLNNNNAQFIFGNYTTQGLTLGTTEQISNLIGGTELNLNAFQIQMVWHAYSTSEVLYMGGDKNWAYVTGQIPATPPWNFFTQSCVVQNGSC